MITSSIKNLAHSVENPSKLTKMHHSIWGTIKNDVTINPFYLEKSIIDWAYDTCSPLYMLFIVYFKTQKQFTENILVFSSNHFQDGPRSQVSNFISITDTILNFKDIVSQWIEVVEIVCTNWTLYTFICAFILHTRNNGRRTFNYSRGTGVERTQTYIFCIFIPCMRACLPHTVILGPYTSRGKTNNIHEATSCHQRRTIA